MRTQSNSQPVTRLLSFFARSLTVVVIASIFAACATIGHKHTEAALFVGKVDLTTNDLKGFQQPRFIYLDGKREITWTLKAPAGSSAVLSGLTFMEDPTRKTDFDSGTVSVSAGESITLRLKEGATGPVYEYRVTITIGGVDYPVNYPPKVIP